MILYHIVKFVLITAISLYPNIPNNSKQKINKSDLDRNKKVKEIKIMKVIFCTHDFFNNLNYYFIDYFIKNGMRFY